MPTGRTVARTLGPMSHLDRRARVGKAIRDLGHAVVGHQTNDEALDHLATTLESFTTQLATGEPRQRPSSTFPSRIDDRDPTGPAHPAHPADQLTFTGFDDRPVSGRSSPWSLDPAIRRIDDEIEAVVTLHSAHEGAPGRAHGGIISALLDDLFGFVLAVTTTPAFTGELTIRYEGPTPLHVPLTCRVRLASAEGRKLFMTGEITAPNNSSPKGSICVRAKATFITIDATKIPGWGEGV